MTSARPKRAATARWYAAALLFLAPLKFGGVIGLGDDPFFPIGGWQWLFFTWPPFLMSFLAGTAYVLALAAHPGPVSGRGRWPVLAWLALAGTALLGLVRTTEWDYALPFICHLASAAVFAAAVRRLLAHDERARSWLVGALSLAVLWCCISGFRQHFGGLEELRAMAQQQAAEKGQKLDGEILDKMAQTRVYGTFQIANLYAAHLVLATPLLLVVLWRFGGRFEPKKLSQPLLMGIGALLFLGSLYWSGSRGAVLGLAAGLGLAGLSLPALRRWRIPIVLVAIVVGVALMYVVGGGRNLLSASARFGYYRSAWTMFCQNPVLGGGLGEFYPRHLQLRALGAEPTRMPHNMLLCLLGQAGLFAGLATLGCMLLPAWLAFAKVDEEDKGDWAERLAILVGVAAWSAHSLVDLNVQVPGTLITVACLPLLALRDRPVEGGACAATWAQRLGRAGQLLLVGVALLGIWRLPGERAFQVFDTSLRDRRPLPVLWEQGASASRLLPTSPNPDRVLGYLAESTKNPQAAVAAYEKAVSRSPHRAALWDRLARARLGVGDLTGAGSAINLALAWNPGYAQYQAHAALVRGLRSERTLPYPARDLISTAMAANYDLNREASTDAMVLLVYWSAELPASPVPLAAFVSWLNSHAGAFAPTGLPVRFEKPDAWTSGH